MGKTRNVGKFDQRCQNGLIFVKIVEILVLLRYTTPC